ncbi:hypothetical protein BB558_006380 [Smittium angustum]|uniref:Uncharacterized protein n=1 Tax=Smittium angustum TaxID=133377 RepID=A0A2U1IXX6_SMIAN|nr:hypothetical protein BB558_006380 [Smittium angustum]
MSGKFSRLFRNSKVASFDPKINQVYTTFQDSKRVGNWGMKHNLPKAVRTNYIEIKKLDTFEQIPLFKSAKSRVMQLNAFKENFLFSASPIKSESVKKPVISGSTKGFLKNDFGVAPISLNRLENFDNLESVKIESKPKVERQDIALIGKKQWKEILEKAKALKKEWVEGLESRKYDSGKYLEFMDLTGNSSVQPGGFGKISMFDINHSGSNKKEDKIVWPTVHNYTPLETSELAVTGRILNHVDGGFAVGIQGTIAFLPAGKRIHKAERIYRELQTFYVTHIDFDSSGKPIVEVSMFHNKQNMKNDRPGGNSGYKYRSPLSKNLIHNDKAKTSLHRYMKLTDRSHVKPSGENVQKSEGGNISKI